MFLKELDELEENDYKLGFEIKSYLTNRLWMTVLFV